tara:strand:- start:354 stop:848 length:495 start_codon:yes stop_codon:yes gene_type:complete
MRLTLGVIVSLFGMSVAATSLANACTSLGPELEICADTAGWTRMDVEGYVASFSHGETGGLAHVIGYDGDAFDANALYEQNLVAGFTYRMLVADDAGPVFHYLTMEMTHATEDGAHPALVTWVGNWKDAYIFETVFAQAVQGSIDNSQRDAHMRLIHSVKEIDA